MVQLLSKVRSDPFPKQSLKNATGLRPKTTPFRVFQSVSTALSSSASVGPLIIKQLYNWSSLMETEAVELFESR
ncbi:unnamed protein product [Larinioides sclopetarius]|uniref:Uncharacterized protein n=1 Tax=Larinioides sclopetarius TaxID=280406 RepID=A0AAV1Z572_9ARAC